MVYKYNSRSKASLQSYNTIDPVNLWAYTLQLTKTEKNALVQLLNNPKLIVHYLSSLVSIV